jgi:hypothetical protein
MTYKESRTESTMKNDEDVVAWAMKFIERYRPALEALGNK